MNVLKTVPAFRRRVRNSEAAPVSCDHVSRLPPDTDPAPQITVMTGVPASRAERRVRQVARGVDEKRSAGSGQSGVGKTMPPTPADRIGADAPTQGIAVAWVKRVNRADAVGGR